MAVVASGMGAKCWWGQSGAVNWSAAHCESEACLKVVMHRCPKIERLRSVWKPRLDLKI